MAKNLSIEISDADADYAPPVIEQSQPDVARVDVQYLRVRIADAAYRINARFEFRYRDSEWQLYVPEEWESQKFEILDWDNWDDVADSVASPIRAMVRAFFVPEFDVAQFAELRAAAIDAKLAEHRAAIDALESSKRR